MNERVRLGYETARGAVVVRTLLADELEGSLRSLHARRVAAVAWLASDRDHEVGWVWQCDDGRWVWQYEERDGMEMEYTTPHGDKH